MHTKIISYFTISGILFLLLMPVQINGAIPHADHAVHSISFAILTFLFNKKLTIRKSVLLAFLIGIVVECIQHFMESRSASILDVIANTTGILAMWLVLVIKVKRLFIWN